jgi:hypothetical protein
MAVDFMVEGLQEQLRFEEYLSPKGRKNQDARENYMVGSFIICSAIYLYISLSMSIYLSLYISICLPASLSIYLPMTL